MEEALPGASPVAGKSVGYQLDFPSRLFILGAMPGNE
jgi:hypothetical protein